eukprot:448159-Rhodomonas_salina.4
MLCKPDVDCSRGRDAALGVVEAAAPRCRQLTTSRWGASKLRVCFKRGMYWDNRARIEKVGAGERLGSRCCRWGCSRTGPSRSSRSSPPAKRRDGREEGRESTMSFGIRFFYLDGEGGIKRVVAAPHLSVVELGELVPAHPPL